MQPELMALKRTIEQMLFGFGGTLVVALGLITWLGTLWLGRQLQNERSALEHKLEGYRLELSAALAAYTARTGLLSEIQLRSTESIWAKLFRLHWGMIRRASPLQSIDVPSGMDLEEARDRHARETLGNLEKERIVLLEAVHERRPFLPEQLFGQLDKYCLFLYEMVALLAEHDEDERVSLPDEEPAVKVARGREYREKRDAVLKQSDDLHNVIADEIRKLTSPTLTPPKQR